MPFTPPEPDASGTEVDEKVLVDYREQVQEREVRLAAQRLLAAHLHPGPDADQPAATFWANIDLDLTGATLIDFDLDSCTPRYAIFTSAIFTGDTDFELAYFSHHVDFESATFTDHPNFQKATFIEGNLGCAAATGRVGVGSGRAPDPGARPDGGA